jgi:hypothetical protein
MAIEAQRDDRDQLLHQQQAMSPVDQATQRRSEQGRPRRRAPCMPRPRPTRRRRAGRAWMLWKTTRREEMTASASSAPAAGASSAGGAAGAVPPAGRPAPSCCTSLTSVATCCDRSRASCSSALPHAPYNPGLNVLEQRTPVQTQALCSNALRRNGWLSLRDRTGIWYPIAVFPPSRISSRRPRMQRQTALPTGRVQ